MVDLKCDMIEGATEGCCLLVDSIFTKLAPLTVLKRELSPIQIPCGFSAENATVSTYHATANAGMRGITTVLLVTVCDGVDSAFLDYAYEEVILI